MYLEGSWKIIRTLAGGDQLFYLGNPRAAWDGPDVSGQFPSKLSEMRQKLDSYIAGL